MQFNSVKNHDDFYSNETDDKYDCFNCEKSIFRGITSMQNNKNSNQIPHIRDAFGCNVMYDASIKDFEDLEKELILLASQYICRSTGIRK